MNRLARLQSMYENFKNIGFHLLLKHNGDYSIPLGTDDLGYFLYSTMFSVYFKFSALNGANFFYYTLTLIGIVAIGACFFSISKTRLGLFPIVIGLIRLSMPLLELNHVYIAYFISFIPMVCLLLIDQKHSKKSFLVLGFIGGIISSFSNNIRILSALPSMIFCAIYLVFNNSWSKSIRLSVFFFFCLGYSLPLLHFNYEIFRRNTFLKQHNISVLQRERHVFWHNIYTGFGFLHNDEGIAWNDTCGDRAAQKENPKAKYANSLYEETIKKLVFRLCKEKRYFVLTTIFAKFGVILYFFLIYFGWIGLFISWYYPKPWYIELSFWGALSVSALPGVMTIPVTPYLIGFITCTMLYAIYSSIWVLNQRIIK